MASRTTHITFKLTVKQFIALKNAVENFDDEYIVPWDRQCMASLNRTIKKQLNDASPEVRNEIMQTMEKMEEEERILNEQYDRQVKLMQLRDLLLELGDVSQDELENIAV